MPILSKTQSILGPPRGSYREQDWKRLPVRARYVVQKIFEIAPLYQVDPWVAIAMFLVETDDGTSPRFVNDDNIAGISIVSDSTEQSFRFDSLDEAVHTLCWMLALMVLKENRPELQIPMSGGILDWLNRVWVPKIASPNFPSNITVDRLGLSYRDGDKGIRAVWALDPLYGTKLVNRLDSDMQSVPTGGSSVAISTKRFRKQLVGFQSNVPNQKLNVGPGQLEGITHNTDNTNVGANAQMHRDFVANGGGQYNVSFHATADSKEIIQILKLDQVAWHASDGCDDRETDEGCFWGIAIEGCMNADGDINITFENVAYWMAMVEAGDSRIDYGTMPKEYFKGFISRSLGHIDVSYDGKYCPRAFIDLYGNPGWRIKLAQRANVYLAEMNVIPVPTELFRGLSHGDLAAVFGTLGEFKYDPTGPLSTLFRERWVKEGRIAPLARAIQREKDRIFIFTDGWTVQAVGSKFTELSDRETTK